MKKEFIVVGGIVTLVLIISLSIVIGGFFIFMCQESSSGKNTQNSQTEDPLIPDSTNSDPMPDQDIPQSTPIPSPTPLDIKISDVKSISFRTSYEGFFEEDKRCEEKKEASDVKKRCTMEISFERNKEASKKLIIKFYEQNAGKTKSEEKYLWKAKMSEQQFNEFTAKIIDNDTFKYWNDGVLMTWSNTSILVDYGKGTRQVLFAFTDEKILKGSLIDNFRSVKLDWKKLQ